LSNVKLFTGLARSVRAIVKYPKPMSAGSAGSTVIVTEVVATSAPEGENALRVYVAVPRNVGAKESERFEMGFLKVADNESDKPGNAPRRAAGLRRKNNAF
jgi:hypothetical protein